jgi:hypothetical protein
MHKQLAAGNSLGTFLRKTLEASSRGALAKVRPSAKPTVQRPAAGALALSGARVTAEDISKARAIASREIQQRTGGLYSPAFVVTAAVRTQELAKASATPNAAPSHAGVKATALDLPKPQMRAPGEELSAGINVGDPRAVLNAQHRASAAAHDRLLASMKEALKPTRNASTGPEAL